MHQSLTLTKIWLWSIPQRMAKCWGQQLPQRCLHNFRRSCWIRQQIAGCVDSTPRYTVKWVKQEIGSYLAQGCNLEWRSPQAGRGRLSANKYEVSLDNTDSGPAKRQNSTLSTHCLFSIVAVFYVKTHQNTSQLISSLDCTEGAYGPSYFMYHYH